MHLTASGLASLLQQPKLVCHLGFSKHWDASQATASPPISKLHLLSFKRFQGCWPQHSTPIYCQILLALYRVCCRHPHFTLGCTNNLQSHLLPNIVFCIVMLAVFKIFFLGAYLPLALACSTLGGALTPP